MIGLLQWLIRDHDIELSKEERRHAMRLAFKCGRYLRRSIDEGYFSDNLEEVKCHFADCILTKFRPDFAIAL